MSEVPMMRKGPSLATNAIEMAMSTGLSDKAFTFVIEQIGIVRQLEETAQSFFRLVAKIAPDVKWEVLKYEPHYDCVILKPLTKDKNESFELRKKVSLATDSWQRPHKDFRHEIEYPHIPVGF